MEQRATGSGHNKKFTILYYFLTEATFLSHDSKANPHQRMTPHSGIDQRLHRFNCIRVMILRRSEQTTLRAMACDVGLDRRTGLPVWPKRVERPPVGVSLLTNVYDRNTAWVAARPTKIFRVQAGLVYSESVAQRAWVRKQKAKKEYHALKKQFINA